MFSVHVEQVYCSRISRVRGCKSSLGGRTGLLYPLYHYVSCYLGSISVYPTCSMLAWTCYKVRTLLHFKKVSDKVFRTPMVSICFKFLIPQESFKKFKLIMAWIRTHVPQVTAVTIKKWMEIQDLKNMDTMHGVCGIL